MKYQIETERLILRPVVMDDAEAMYEYACNPLVTRYVTWDVHNNFEETQSVIRNFFLSKEADPAWIPSFAVVVKETGQMIGVCDTVLPIDRYGRVEVGYVMNPVAWNKGYTTEACRALCAYLFNEMGVRRISIRHHVDNIASQRVIEKCGFVKEGVQRQLIRFGDVFADVALYSMFKEELK